LKLSIWLSLVAVVLAVDQEAVVAVLEVTVQASSVSQAAAVLVPNQN
jgi:hypothetical protein